MLDIDEHLIVAFEAKEAKQVVRRFIAWWRQHANFLGMAGEADLGCALEAGLAEAELAGLDNEKDIFQFVAGRYLIPQCEGLTYAALLDLICDDSADEADRLALIAHWAGMPV